MPTDRVSRRPARRLRETDPTAPREMLPVGHFGQPRPFALAGDAKRRRHALQLAVNLADLLGTGRFDPQLTAVQAAQITRLAADADSMQLSVDQLSPLHVEL